MKYIKIILTIFGVIATFITILTWIDYQIENKINDIEFIKKVATEVQIPFVLFDINGRILFDSGAMKYIEEIKINKEGITEFTIIPNRYLSVAPILQSIDYNIDFAEPQRGKKFEWIYRKAKATGGARWEDTASYEAPPIRRFKLEIIGIQK